MIFGYRNSYPRFGAGALAITACMTLAAAVPICARAQGWGPEERVTTSVTDSETGLSRSPMAADSRGRVHIVWCEQDGAALNYQINARTRGVVTWESSQRAVAYAPAFPGSSGGAKYPAIVADAEDSVHIAWHDYRVGGIQNVEIFTKSRGADAGWDTSGAGELRLTRSNHAETNGDNSYVPSLYQSATGEVGAVWFDFRFDNENAEILFKARAWGAGGGEWDTTAGDGPDMNLSQTPGNSTYPAVAAAPSGAVHVVWMEQGAGVAVLHRVRDAVTNAWGVTETVVSGNDVIGYPAAAVDAAGVLHVVWVDARDGSQAIFARARLESGTWGSESRVSPAGVNAQEPAVAASVDGMIHVAWHDTRVSLLNREVYLQSKSASDSWDPSGASDYRVSSASAHSTRPSLLADALGNLHVLWKDRRDGNAEIYYRAWRNPALTGVLWPSDGWDDALDALGGASANISAPIAARVFPNPVRDGALGAIDIARAGPLSIALYDVAGRRVRDVWSGVASAGTRYVPIEFGGTVRGALPRGVYFLRAESAGCAASARILFFPEAGRR
ncbi:MAG: T9SS type A sorting domain-containing protein [bacterium]